MPQGWEEKNLSELVSYKKGKKPKRMESTRFPDSLVYLDIKAIEKGNDEIFVDTASSNHTDENDLIVVWDGARAGWVGKSRVGALGSTIMALTPKINRDYLFRFLQTQFDHIQSNHRGTGIPHVDPSIFWNIQVPVAPLPEQERIVAKLDAIMQKVEANKQRLEKIPKLLKRFRQAVLSAAVSGRLTEEWRKMNLVKQVLKYDEFKNKSQNEDLPDSWAMISVEEYLINFDKGRIPISQELRKKRQGDFPYYGATGIIDSIDGFTHDGEFILLSEDGMNLIYRNKPQAFTAKGKIWVNNHAHVLQTKNGFENKYAVMCFNSIDLAPYLTGIDQVKLTQGNLNIIELPIAPKEEQREIVQLTDQLFTFADKIESRYIKAKVMLDRLPQSVLGKAFRGELVGQDVL